MFSQVKTKHLIIPYVIGIIWFLCHPIISVVTGELKCRGIYTDEHQLDARTFLVDQYPVENRRIPNNFSPTGDSSSVIKRQNSAICGVLDTLGDQNYRGDPDAFNPFASPYVTCLDHQTHPSLSGYNVVQIKPSLAPTTSVEALVLVIPYTPNWFDSELHSALLTFIERMSITPWLAKDILILSPESNSTATKDTVTSFINDLPSLPMTLSKLMIRQLVVLEWQSTDDFVHNHFVVLTQGAFGTVPNLDLVSGLTTSINQVFGRNMDVRMHSFDLAWLKIWVNKHLPKGAVWQEWGIDLGNMIAFMVTFWRPAPHAAALAEGIDSVTIRANLHQNPDDQNLLPAIRTVTLIEHLFRALNSLSERLHHNVNQYLLPSSTKFVSHGEYIIPAILIMLPLVARVFLLLQDLESFQFRIAAASTIGVLLVEMMISFLPYMTKYRRLTNVVLAIAYFFALKLASTSSVEDNKVHERQSIQFMACMLSLYMHVPLALSHFSLFLVSAIVWVPLVAFLDYGNCGKVRKVPGILMVIMLGVAVSKNVAPMLVLSSYAHAVVLPLHFLVLVLSL